ncbi:MAG: ATP-dependent Lon protease [Halanaerobiales bacterium]|nr:ATP-dependent Lon protease [Halanaerobiales bacterium]
MPFWMKPFWRGWFEKKEKDNQNDEKFRQIKALYKKATDFYGQDKFIMKASRVDVLDLITSDKIKERLTALERIVYDDPTIEIDRGNLDERILRLENKIADLLAERSVERDLEEQIAERMQRRQKEYLKEIKKEIVRGEQTADNAQTLRKLAQLEKLESRSLNRSTLDLVRPQTFEEVIGQDLALKALVSKIASPYPQHVILYGPPGVGKTTAARLALEEAKKKKNTPFYEDSKFVEVDGSTLRWDPREVTNPLLGSVHDPIYQGAKRNLADGGVPEPKTGLVTEAHGGVLFIDEIGELDPMLQNKLLKVMEDKRVMFESSYFDENDENIPLYIKKLFKEGAPADFILIGATTRSPEEINPAFRSRCAEVFFNPLTKQDIQKIVRNAVKKLGVKIEEEIPVIISDYTIEGRTAINLLLDAYSLVLYENENKDEYKLLITKDKLYEAIQNRRMTPCNKVKVDEQAQVGKIFGLGVRGFIGSVIEIEAMAFPADEKGKGRLRFNETAGSMAKDSLFNAAAVVRKITGKNMNDYDLHVNIVGGGNVDGPSAGIAMLLAIISAIEEIPLKQDLAVTGEVSIQGKIKPVGGIREKLHAAEQAGLKEVLIPEENINDINQDTQLKVTPVSTVTEALKKVLIYDEKKLSIVK